MSFLGMGTLEILVILLVAFILLGPERMIDAGRLMGRATREVRRLTEGLNELRLDDPATGPEGTSVTPRDGALAEGDDAEESTPKADDDAPVTFESSASSKASGDGDATQGPEGQDRP